MTAEESKSPDGRAPQAPERGPHGAWVAGLVALLLLGVGSGGGLTVEDVIADLRHKDADRRQRAAEFLGNLRRGDLAGEVEPLVRDKDRAVRREAVRTLGKLRSTSSIPVLAELLKEPALADKAVESLVEIGGFEALELIQGLLDSPNEDLRKEAKKGLRVLEEWHLQWQVRNPEGQLVGKREEIIPDLAKIAEAAERAGAKP